MNRPSPLRSAYLTHLSRPAQDRLLYRTIRKQRAKRILEIGVGLGCRSQRMIEMATRVHQPDDVHFVGIDLFEARPPHSAGLTLKRAHRLLKATGAQIRLVPGQPFDALIRTANSLPNLDLIVISADQDDESLERAWFYFPRMLHAQSVVYREKARGYEPVQPTEVARRAA